LPCSIEVQISIITACLPRIFFAYSNYCTCRPSISGDQEAFPIVIASPSPPPVTPAMSTVPNSKSYPSRPNPITLYNSLDLGDDNDFPSGLVPLTPPPTTSGDPSNGLGSDLQLLPAVNWGTTVTTIMSEPAVPEPALPVPKRIARWGSRLGSRDHHQPTGRSHHPHCHHSGLATSEVDTPRSSLHGARQPDAGGVVPERIVVSNEISVERRSMTEDERQLLQIDQCWNIQLGLHVDSDS
jgi:hypothetical protein